MIFGFGGRGLLLITYLCKYQNKQSLFNTDSSTSIQQFQK